MALNRTDVSADIREDYYHTRLRESGPRYAGFDLPTVEATLNVALTYDLLHQCQARYMSEFGLSKSTLNILLVLRHGPQEGMLLHGLGEMLLVSRANITGLIDHMEAQGLVNRVVDESDRRARFARITGEGEALLDRFMPVHYSNSMGLLGDLSGEDKLVLIKLLRKLRESIRQHSENKSAKL